MKLIFLALLVAVAATHEQTLREMSELQDMRDMMIWETFREPRFRCDIIPCPLNYRCIRGRCVPHSIFNMCSLIRCPIGTVCIRGRCVRIPDVWEEQPWRPFPDPGPLRTIEDELRYSLPTNLRRHYSVQGCNPGDLNCEREVREIERDMSREVPVVLDDLLTLENRYDRRLSRDHFDDSCNRIDCGPNSFCIRGRCVRRSPRRRHSLFNQNLDYDLLDPLTRMNRFGSLNNLDISGMERRLDEFDMRDRWIRDPCTVMRCASGYVCVPGRGCVPSGMADRNRIPFPFPFPDPRPTMPYTGNERLATELPVAWMPDTRVEREDTVVRFSFDLPGVKKTDVNIKVRDHTLIVSGTRVSGRDKDDTLVRDERQLGRFYRSFELPDDIKTDKVTAFWDHGVLTVTVPVTDNSTDIKIA